MERIPLHVVWTVWTTQISFFPLDWFKSTTVWSACKSLCSSTLGNIPFLWCVCEREKHAVLLVT